MAAAKKATKKAAPAAAKRGIISKAGREKIRQAQLKRWKAYRKEQGIKAKRKAA